MMKGKFWNDVDTEKSRVEEEIDMVSHVGL